MENNRSSFNAENVQNVNSVDSNTHVRTFISGVFSWMFLALVLSGLTAWLFANNESLLGLLIKQTATGSGLTILGWVVMLAPLGLVLLMNFALEKLSVPVLIGLFAAYSILLGASLSFIFLVYLGGTILKAFLLSAGVFAIMAVLGYTTKMDLTNLGRILFIGLIGVIVAMVVNIFLKSQMMSIIIDSLCVIIFTGLIAYKMQNIKELAHATEGETDSKKRKFQIISALSLYITFVNLFLTLLRIFGRRD
jgi:uncharacterized protein